MRILKWTAAAAMIGAGLLAAAPASAWDHGRHSGWRGPGYGYGYDYAPPRYGHRPHWRRWARPYHRGWGPPPGYYRPGW